MIRDEIQRAVFEDCRRALPGWAGLAFEDFELDDPKGFSSFTMGVRARQGVAAEPRAVLYRRLEGKQNAILDFKTEREVFLALGQAGIAARCHHYDRRQRIEAFHAGRTLTADDLGDAAVLEGIAGELVKLHRLAPAGLPKVPFFEGVFAKWGPLAARVLEDHAQVFPAREQEMCRELRQLYAPETLRLVQSMLPEGPVGFAHNDTYHGNIMMLETGEIRLLDFEFSCLNHQAYDLANLFAETVMVHGLPEYPHFRIDPPRYGDRELAILIGAYVDRGGAAPGERDRLTDAARRLMVLSDFKYALAGVTLALEPIQKIRFIPYAHARFQKFLAAV